MSPRDKIRAQHLAQAVLQYEHDVGTLPGLAGPGRLDALVAQFLDSLRRVEFAQHIRDAEHHKARADPTSNIFDPLRAAVLHNRRGNYDEAWWLVFLATHFGKHGIDGWRLTRDVYGKLGQGGLWNWSAVSRDPPGFETWLASSARTLKGGDGVSRRFSNHRKYETLSASSSKGTAQVIRSYVAWVAPPRNHAELVRDMNKRVGQDPRVVFAALYSSMSVVHRFGRLAKFDFLAMLGKLGIGPIEPGSAFLKGASGPLAGARLLFGGASDAAISAGDLESRLAQFGQKTGLGPQVLEDAICNWQKRPAEYVRFRG